MTRPWTLGGGLATAASLGLLGIALRPSPTPARPPVVAATRFAPAFVPQGAGSCAAASCHGGGAKVSEAVSKVYRNEHTTWIDRDPHASAFDALGSARSERIARNLGKAKGDYVPAERDARCLACHATPGADLAGPTLADTIRRDGVGCESCHGPASGWLAEHTRVDWDARPPAAKAAFGFVDLRDLPARASACAGCHVGAPADPSRGLPLRDVNHDLIAAGHPRLTWEFSAYTANEAKHWRQDRNPPDLDARLWEVGQFATLRAAADLLHDRAERARLGSAPWPELSESSCFACHFSLKENPFRGLRDPDGPPLGVPSWASWHLPGFLAIARDDPASADALAALKSLRSTMNAFTPDPAAAAAASLALRDALDRRLASHPPAPVSLDRLNSWVSLLNARDTQNRRPLVTGWDSAAQLYLGLAALCASQSRLAPGGADPALKADLESLREGLGFPRGFDSPRDFDPSRAR